MALKISRILHAGYLFDDGKTKIVFDPIFETSFSTNCSPFPKVTFDFERIKTLKVDAVFISHYHDDHCSFDSLNLLNRETPIYIFCIHDELFSLVRELGFKHVYSLELNSTIGVGKFEIIPRRALDEDVDSIFHIKCEGLNILNVVDSWIGEETLRILAETATWDLVLWPFQTMREIEVIAPRRVEPQPARLPEEWISQLRILNPRFIVPSSCQLILEDWSWYNHAFFPITYRYFESEIEKEISGAKVVRLNPSVTIILDKHSLEFTKPLDFIKPVGAQDVDYDFKENQIPPKTVDISKNFRALTPNETTAVIHYCKHDLVKKYNRMAETDEPYFKGPRVWCLSLSDRDGDVTKLSYRVQKERIELIDKLPEPIEWLTEVPIFKLFNAVCNGEALTSMYVRINDMEFTSEIEKEIKDADIMEDPLIRCLFTGVFAAYQKAQLKRIKIKGIGR